MNKKTYIILDIILFLIAIFLLIYVCIPTYINNTIIK